MSTTAILNGWNVNMVSCVVVAFNHLLIIFWQIFPSQHVKFGRVNIILVLIIKIQTRVKF